MPTKQAPNPLPESQFSEYSRVLNWNVGEKTNVMYRLVVVDENNNVIRDFGTYDHGTPEKTKEYAEGELKAWQERAPDLNFVLLKRTDTCVVEVAED